MNDRKILKFLHSEIHIVKIANKPGQVCTILHPVENGFLWATTFSSFLTAHFSILFYWETSALEKGRPLVPSKGALNTFLYL